LIPPGRAAPDELDVDEEAEEEGGEGETDRAANVACCKSSPYPLARTSSSSRSSSRALSVMDAREAGMPSGSIELELEEDEEVLEVDAEAEGRVDREAEVVLPFPGDAMALALALAFASALADRANILRDKLIA
jgi:hypothetical protein